jgi:hypothetical protein
VSRGFSLRGPSSRSRWVPRQPPDALENLPKEAPRQVAFGELRGEAPRVPDEAPAGLEEPLLETREGPTLDRERQDQSTQEIAEVVGDDPERQADLVGPNPMAREPGPVNGGLGSGTLSRKD